MSGYNNRRGGGGYNQGYNQRGGGYNNNVTCRIQKSSDQIRIQ